jgi:hypothetical protein
MAEVLSAPSPTRWIAADPAEAAAKTDVESFAVSHRLADHPLFSLEALMLLAERTLAQRPADLYYDMGKVSVEQRWRDIGKGPFSPQEALARIESSGAWFIFRAAQRDPDYRELFQQAIGDIKAIISDKVRRRILREDIIIFITSPNRVTTYHMDRECNFLLQIHGQKDLYLFRRDDREVLPEDEIERFWTVDNNAPTYRPDLQSRATTYLLAPGNGVHIPVNCPHWLKNADNVSVSLSVNFQFVDSVRANQYRANYYLRRAGLSPSPPGASPVRDALKDVAIKAATNVRRALGKSSADYWT